MFSLTDKVVLVTGGTGSFGQSFVRQLLEQHNPKKVIIFSRDELKQYRLQKELSDSRLRFFIGDVRDLPRLHRAFAGVDVVIHAAALKQVPALEYNPSEAVKTNIIGSQNVIEAAIDEGVSKVVLISTDKAAYPVNLYGSTKLCAEKLFVAANSYSGGKTQLSAVRYGNVLGSRGSVVETILKNKNGGVVHITHEEMTRFWINLEAACALVMFALEEMVGGEIFVPKIASMKLIDLVETLVPGVRREIVGIRPGEKMHEVLLTDQEARHSVELDKYYVILPEFPFWADTEYQKYYERGKPAAADFVYASHTNDVWLTPEALRAMLSEVL
jgi:UDP-N-acetylglucosamine 4,6-dehydratase